MTRRISLSVGVLALVIIGAAGALSILRAQQAPPSPQTSARQADLILSNGKIITVDERFTIAQAVAITGDRIVAVGTQSGDRAAGGAEHQADRPDGTGRHPWTHRQPSASPAGG